MRSINRIFTLFVVLAAFSSARSFGGEFTPMTTLFDSVGVGQTVSLGNRQEAVGSSLNDSTVSPTTPAALPSSPEDIQFPEPADDVDLTLIPAPPKESRQEAGLGARQEAVGSSNSPVANSVPNSLATRNSQPTDSIKQVGFYLPEQNAIPAAPRSTLPDPSINDPDYNFQLKIKPAPFNVKTVAQAPQQTNVPVPQPTYVPAPQPTYIPADVKTIVDAPVTNPFAQTPAVGLGSRQEAVGSSNYPLATHTDRVGSQLEAGSAKTDLLGGITSSTRPYGYAPQLATNPQALPIEPVVEGSNPQMFREDFDYQQLRAEMIGEIDKRAWTSGDFQIIPYAKLWASVSYENKPTQIGSAPFFVTPPSNIGKQAHVDYRGTILGFNMKAKNLTLWEGSKVMGKVEFDLQRTIDFDNKTTVHLRHCYIEAVSEDARLLLGQTWDIVSPLMPGTLMYSAGWMDGNVGYRRAQFRLERYLNVSECFQWKLQGCVSAPFAGDSGNLLGKDYRLKYGSWPIVQGRIAAVIGCRRCQQKPMEIGFAAHVGELQYGLMEAGKDDTNYLARTWGIYLDAYVPITCWFGVQGELFKGENLAMFLGGINQGVMRSAAGTPESIAAQGGWINLWFNLNPCTQLRVGYMIDDPQGRIDEIPLDSDLQARTLNHSLFANIKHDITKQWWIGLEYSHVETGWAGKKDTGVSVCDRVDFVSYFSF